jgi:hypothetical protein
MERQNKTDSFLIRDRANKFLAAGAGQTEDILDPVIHCHF